MLIYVAGPYSSPDCEGIKKNIQIAKDIAHQLVKKGHSPFVPHLYHYIELPHDKLGYEQWMSIGRDFLLKCDALYFISPSPGADRELKLAQDMNMEIFRSMDEVKDVNVKDVVPKTIEEKIGLEEVK